MISFTSAELHTWVASLLWPLARILGLIATAPPFGNVSVPVSTKLGLGVLLALIIAPLVPPVPAMDPMSFAGLMILAQQMVVGLAMGFVMRIVFSAVEMAGTLAGMTMGLSFATFFDPQSRGQSTAISQFLVLIATLVFLAVNAHLVLLSALADSFQTLPISSAPLGNGGFNQIVLWGGRIFSSGVQLSLPIVAALLIINLALGILTRSAPQLNLFGIGFPITLFVGFLVFALAIPYMGVPLQHLFEEGMETVLQMFMVKPLR